MTEYYATDMWLGRFLGNAWVGRFFGAMFVAAIILMVLYITYCNTRGCEFDDSPVAAPVVDVKVDPIPKLSKYDKMEFDGKDRKCLTQNIYFEARNQDLEGKLGVLFVTLNRVLSEKYPNDICEVVWQYNIRGKRKIPMFSWTLDGKSDIMRDKKSVENIENLLNVFINNVSIFDDVTYGALNYHAYYVKPLWRYNLDKVTVIGDHIFYR